MLRIGIISSSITTAQRTIQLAENMLDRNTHKYKFFVYNSLQEIKNILAGHVGDIDGWLFTGPNPYYAVKPYLETEDNVAYGATTGIEVYKYLLEYLYETRREKLRVSIDCPEQEGDPFRDALAIVDIPIDEIYFQNYSIPYDLAAIVAKHEALWRAKQVDIVFTTLHVVQLEMEKQQIPCKRIEVSRAARRQAISLLEQKLTGLYFRNSQLGMLCIEIRDYDEFVSRAGNYYKVQKLELVLKERMLDFCQKIDGYLAEKSNGHYEIFASRGLIEKYAGELRSFIEELQLSQNIEFLGGIGLAATVFNAQLNAHKALANGRRENKQLIIVADEGRIIEEFGTVDELRYRAETEEPLLTAKLREASVGIQTYNRIAFILRKMGWATFSAAQLAQQLNVTSRNIQRILVGLKKAGLIKEAGQETLSRRGRPTKMYRFP
jgi:hypothetical protein